jgi:diguanylate cyclase (GGDEF)-like protein
MDKVLVVEDSPEISAMMALTLQLEGYEVVQAGDGLQALEAARNTRLDLILLDVMMPGLSGFEVAQALKANQSTADIPIIFVTAKHEVDDLVQGLEVAVDYISKPFAVPELVARVRAALRMRKLQNELKASNEQLSRLAVTDGLTGLLNRRGFDQQLEDELWRARRFGHSIGLVLFDLDHFKRVNDTWGHAQGDIVLQAFASVLMHSSRRVDKVARFGGEEFALLLPATDELGVDIVCEKVRSATEALRVPCSHADGTSESIQITTSGGGVVIPKIGENGIPMSELAAGMFEISDRSLYQAKQSGRNRIITQICTDEAVAAIGASSNSTNSSRAPGALATNTGEGGQP